MTLGRFAQVVGAALALLLAAWLTLVWWGGRTAAAAYRATDYTLSEDRYSLAAAFMVAERWKAHFGAGTAVLESGNPARAEDLLRQALAEVPDERQCVVRVNLSLAQERQGDAAQLVGDRPLAVDFYEAALQTLRDGRCPALDDTAAESEERLTLKLQDPEADPDEASGDGGDDQDDGQDGSGSGPGASPSPDPGDNQSGEPNPDATSGAGGDSDPPSPGAGDGSDDSNPSGSDGDAEEDDLSERLDRLGQQNRRGQVERQDQIDPDNPRRSWDQPVW
ncbi:MAG: hypothetical protein LBG60_17850 [Bifidobacteriaceae bacterium]|jgi:tetratricopeptide (TPR) repeat protein|nr:hypothetical protein [Bifidobacteriaceae bacterium]